MSEQKILVVDDDRDISELIGVCLKNEGYEVVFTYTAADAISEIEKNGSDIVLALLDVMLPDSDGFELLKKIRESHLFPIIVLTAKVGDIDKITGLTLGADDYITKPFNPIELTARVKTQLRRYTKYNAGIAPDRGDERSLPLHEHDFAGLHICRDSRKCSVFGEEISLTPIEFDILWYLCERRGKVVSSEELFEGVWGEKYLDNNNTVMAHIARLREKMHEPSRKPRFIKTVWGVGYTVE